MDIRDMSDLICVRDAYKAMNKSLHGEEMVLGFHEGYLGALGRVFRVIERNISKKWKKDDDSAMRILDAISLRPEERARLLLDEGKCRIGEEVLKKYKFNKKLKEGILTGRIKGQALVVVDGKELTAQCSAWGNISCTEGLPCLVSENNSRGSMRYTVEAVSFGNEGRKRNWVCLRPVLFEQAVEYFLENHQLENMPVDYDYVNKMSTATAGISRPDFQIGDVWIEVRVLGRNARKSDSFNQRDLVLSIRQVEKYCRQFSPGKETDERMILLLVCQADIKAEQISFKGKTSDEIKKAVEAGVEIWTVEMQMDVDGINLLSYQNITDKVVDN